MPSPFPGMDPYLEARWGDVHASLCPYLREALQPLLPRALRARTEMRVLVEDDSDSERVSYVPDAAVVEANAQRARPAAVGVGVVTLEPFIVAEVGDAPEDRWVQIVDVESGNRVVTAIEILSPGNKVPGRLNREYRAKVDDYLRAGVNVVEIDLLRGRPSNFPVRHEQVPAGRLAEYLYCVHRADQRGRWFAYPMRLRDRLPVVPVPLRRTDADVTIDLQPLIDRIYVAGGHGDIDYARPADPPLSPDDAAWLAGLLERPLERPLDPPLDPRSPT